MTHVDTARFADTVGVFVVSANEFALVANTECPVLVRTLIVTCSAETIFVEVVITRCTANGASFEFSRPLVIFTNFAALLASSVFPRFVCTNVSTNCACEFSVEFVVALCSANCAHFVVSSPDVIYTCVVTYCAVTIFTEIVFRTSKFTV